MRDSLGIAEYYLIKFPIGSWFLKDGEPVKHMTAGIGDPVSVSTSRLVLSFLPILHF